MICGNQQVSGGLSQFLSLRFIQESDSVTDDEFFSSKRESFYIPLYVALRLYQLFITGSTQLSDFEKARIVALRKEKSASHRNHEAQRLQLSCVS